MIGRMAIGVQVVIDCADPARLGEFWAAALDYKVQDPPEGFGSWQEWLAKMGIPEDEWNSANAVVDPDGKGPRIYFQRVPEPKAVKNRLHLDLNVGGPRGTDLATRKERVAREVDRLIALGATRLSTTELRGEHWVTMQDPEGNEFDLQ